MNMFVLQGQAGICSFEKTATSRRHFLLYLKNGLDTQYNIIVTSSEIQKTVISTGTFGAIETRKWQIQPTGLCRAGVIYNK